MWYSIFNQHAGDVQQRDTLQIWAVAQIDGLAVALKRERESSVPVIVDDLCWSFLSVSTRYSFSLYLIRR